MQTLAITTAPTVAPTQKLRDLIEEGTAGLCSFQDLHNELLRVETILGLTLTHPTEEEVA